MKLPSILDNFSNLDSLSAKVIKASLSLSLNEVAVQNYIANRVHFPQTIATTHQEMEIELKLLTEVVKLNTNLFLNHSLRKIIIPQEFDDFYKPRISLIHSVCLGLPLDGQYQLVLHSLNGLNLTGTVLSLAPPKAKQSIFIEIKGSTLEQSIPSIQTYPFEVDNTVYINGLPNKISGGKLGLIIITHII